MAVSSEVGNLARHKEFLIERMDPDSGLLDKLLGKGTLTETEIREIDAKDPYHKRNSELLKFITEQGKDDLLIAALKDSNQNHLVNYLTTNGVNKPDYRDDWPLTEKELTILNKNQGALIDLIDPCDLIVRLYSRSVINRRQMEVVFSKRANPDKNKAILQILRRRSLRDFNQTIACLRESNQSQIAEILVQGGVVVRLHTNIDEPAETVGETENQLSSALQAMIISGKSREEIDLFVDQIWRNCIAARTGQSIVLYIYCQTIDELQKLMDSLTSGLLKSSCEQLFTRLLSRQQKVTLRSITISEEDYSNLRKALEEVPTERQKHGTSEEEVVRCTSTETEAPVSSVEISKDSKKLLEKKSAVDKTKYHEGTTTKIATEKNTEILWTNRTRIQPVIDLDNELYGKMKKNIFSQIEMSNIWLLGQKFVTERVDRPLQMLWKKSDQLFKALEASGQKRLIEEALSEPRNYEREVASDSFTNTEVACWLLTPLQRHYLKCNWSYIINHMTINADVFGKLMERKVFTDIQIKGLKGLQKDYMRNETVLLMLEKSSERQFNGFCDIMHDTKQLVVEEYLRPKQAPLSLPRQEIKPTVEPRSIQEVYRRETIKFDSEATPTEIEQYVGKAKLLCPEPPVADLHECINQTGIGFCLLKCLQLLADFHKLRDKKVHGGD